MMKFEGKVAVITGAGKGIGRAAALAFAREGAAVVCNSLTSSAKEVVREIDGGRRSHFVQGDISQEDTANRIIAETIQRFGKIDILFNNAGTVIPGTVNETDIQDWDTTFAVNVKSVFLMSASALPHLIKTTGTIINSGSSVAVKGVPSRFAYSASKGAVVSMTRSMAVDCLKYGVRVNCICPGTTDTPSLKARIEQSRDPEHTREELLGRQPLGRFGTAEEIAEAVLYLAGASFCTGTVLLIDGGMTA